MGGEEDEGDDSGDDDEEEMPALEGDNEVDSAEPAAKKSSKIEEIN